jgi:hypothetical protein
MNHRAGLMYAAALMLSATPLAAGGNPVSEVGGSIGASFAMSGDSPLEEMSFKQDFDTGLSFNLYAVGPIQEMVSWRVELGRESLSADADRAAGRIDGDYKLLRWQAGVQLAPTEDFGPGRPYAFFTMGLAHQDVSIQAKDVIVDGEPQADVTVDLDGTANYGLSFGGGYNYAIGENWGLGGDLHINAGFFNDSARWWWTPSAQVFYRW